MESGTLNGNIEAGAAGRLTLQVTEGSQSPQVLVAMVQTGS